MTGNSIEALLVQLISNWSGWDTSDWYVDVHAPAIVRNDPNLILMPTERIAVDALRNALNPEQWDNLPSMLKDRMSKLTIERQRLDQEARARPLAERERKTREERERKAREELERQDAECRSNELLAKSALEQTVNTAPTASQGNPHQRFLDLQREEIESGRYVPYREPQNLARKVSEVDIAMNPKNLYDRDD